MNYTKSGKVYIYTETVPALSNSGASVRVYSNIRAYHDLNYEIKVYLFTNCIKPRIPKKLKSKSISFIIINPNLNHSKTIDKKKSVQINEILLNRYFPNRQIIQSYVIKNLRREGQDIHHFEYLSTANSVIGLRGFFIWSNHDIFSERHLLVQKFRNEIGRGNTYTQKIIKYYFYKYVEKLVFKSCRLMLTVSEYDQNHYMDRFKSNKINLLPWSTSNGDSFINKSRRLIGNKIKILHLGNTNAILTYSSLKYILNVLFKNIPLEILQKIELNIVGKHPDAPYSNKVKKLAEEYDQVTFAGFQPDLKPLFQNHDLQIIGSQNATGIRTKIIESWAYGLPVISSEIGARGLYGLKNEENILLMKDHKEFSKFLFGIFNGKYDLNKISMNGRKLYEKRYSREKQSLKLKEYLSLNIN